MYRWIIILILLMLAIGTGVFLWVTDHGGKSDEVIACERLEFLFVAQHNFRENDYYHIGRKTFAKCVAHLYKIDGGESPDLIEAQDLAAFGDDLRGTNARPVAGYTYIDASTGSNSKPLQAGDELVTEFRYFACPETYVTEGGSRYSFMIDQKGVIYRKDLRGDVLQNITKNLNDWELLER